MINVIDSMCGTGKSTKMFELIRQKSRDDVDSKFLYITPFLSEIDERIPRELPELDFWTPENKGKGKIGDLKYLISGGKNVASTHVLFSMLTPELVDILIDKQYTLIIDEAISCVGLLDKTLVHSDVRDLLKSNMVIPDPSKRNQLSWNETDYPEHDGRYAFVRNLCNLGVVYCYADTFLMFEYPPKLLRELEEVWVLTYLFNGSDMRCWLDLNEIQYNIVDNNSLGLLSENEVKKIARENLTILTNRNLDAKQQRVGTLSKSWFNNAKKSDISSYKAMLRSCVVSQKARAGEIFWTTYKDYQTKLQGTGYTKGISEDMPAFLPMNIRATNDYRNYTLCMYAVNIFKNPVEVNYLSSNGITVDEDTYALSEMIQFIWRGCIRQGKPMKVLILSKRMQTLLEGWLNG
jgi:hypothetical protein